MYDLKMAKAFSEKGLRQYVTIDRYQHYNNQDIIANCADYSMNAFRFNANAPAFVPRSPTPAPAPVPISGYLVPCFPILRGTGGTDWVLLGDQEAISLVANSANATSPRHQSKHVLTEEVQRKILKQMEYQFSDMSLLANDNLAMQIYKDPEGYVPIANVSSTKKIKSLVGSNHQLLAEGLRASTKLDVSDDGKRVKRKVPFTDKVKEELQLRTIVAENLPDDHSHQNIEKIFNVAGCVKTIRICHPQDPSTHSKGDFISTKLHALVEFENSESAERAVEKLNDQKNWRKGLRVRCLLRRSPKSVLKSKKSEFDGLLDDYETPPTSIESSPQLSPLPIISGSSSPTETDAEESSGASKTKTWSKGRGKPRHRPTNSFSGRGLLSLSPQLINSSFVLGEPPLTRQTVKGPKMPDGTKGFTMGRGKPISASAPVQTCKAVGCDGSVLLDDTPYFKGEKNAGPNKNSARGFEVIESIKADVERACPSIVSCTDILTLAARESVFLSGGPFWPVSLGRRDALTASEEAANNQLPSPFEPLDSIVAKFASNGLDLKDVVVLSGAHTLGFAQCFTFKRRLFDFKGSGKPDPLMDSLMVASLQSTCPNINESNNKLAPLDVQTVYRFDNAYYKNLMTNSGLLESDQALMGNPKTAEMVNSYSMYPDLYSRDFAASMVKLGNVGVLTGQAGQIRKKCGSVN